MSTRTKAGSAGDDHIAVEVASSLRSSMPFDQPLAGRDEEVARNVQAPARYVAELRDLLMELLLPRPIVEAVAPLLKLREASTRSNADAADREK